jgi:hypothetical protein
MFNEQKCSEIALLDTSVVALNWPLDGGPMLNAQYIFSITFTAHKNDFCT